MTSDFRGPDPRTKRELGHVVFHARVKQAVADLRRGIDKAQVREWHGGIVVRAAQAEMGK